VAELLICFREVLEAALIIGILYTYLSKIGRKDMLPILWRGVIAALVLSLISSVIFQIVAGGFTGQAEKIFEGVVMIIVAIVLGTMIIWMANNTNIAGELESQADSALEKLDSASWGIFSLAFIAVFREGIETVLFLYGVFVNQGSVSFFSSMIGAGAALGIGYMIFVKGQRVPLKTFFNISSVFLIFVAAGMMAYGIHELESAGIIADTGRIWNVNPPVLPNGSYPIFHDKGAIGAIAKGLFGWNGDPSYLEVGIWTLTFAGLMVTWRRITIAPRTV
jgi:high-affinity iron transporter|tara:strand:+ start:505 stop:1338 length:834 start_codon:yes stop_codon:yes gene_type:complete